MSYSVRVLAKAEDDLREIYEYIAQDYPDRAARIVNRILSRIETLADFPRRGAVPRDDILKRSGYRFLVEDPYLIFFKIHEPDVLIYRVIHGKREYTRLL